MNIEVYVVSEFERFVDPPAPLPTNTLANPLGGPGWWVDGDVAHLVEWLSSDETVAPSARRVGLELPEWNLRRLIIGSRLLVVQVVASANGDRDLSVVAALRVDRLLVVGPSADWNIKLLRRVQEVCQARAEWLPVVAIATDGAGMLEYSFG